MEKPSIVFPTVNNSSSNASSAIDNMTAMIEIPSAIVLQELEEGTYIHTYVYSYIIFCYYIIILKFLLP